MANPQAENGHIDIRKQFILKFPILSKNREAIYKRDGYTCFYCGLSIIDTKKFFDMIDDRMKEELTKFLNGIVAQEEYESFNARKEVEESDLYKSKKATIDHKIPIEKGGGNEDENLVTCCASCNSRKRTNIQLENGYTRIANGLLEKFSALQMSGTCWQVLMALLRKLYGYNKKEDWIEYSQIGTLCRLPKSRISYSIRQLREYGIVTQKRNGIRQIISINKDFSIVTQKRNSSIISHKPLRKSVTTVTQTRTTKDNTKETNTKDIATKVAEESFNSSQYIQETMKSPQKHIALIGDYLKGRGETFPTKLAAQKAIKRWLSDSRVLADYPREQVDRAVAYVSSKWPDDWNMSTILKNINKSL